jgi:predicted ATP-grasp superfamily ATP-dependent carboligase
MSAPRKLPRRVLLSDGEERSMLAAARCLRHAGYEVTAAGHSAWACTRWSRASSAWVAIADPREDAARFVEQLADELAARPHAALMPGSDSSLLAISDARTELQALTTLGLPDRDAVARALGREALGDAASAAGLVPAQTIRCADIAEALAAAHELGFPVVLKSISAATRRGGATEGAPKARLALDERSLRRQAPLFGSPLLVQGRLRGELLSFGGVFAGGRLLAVALSRYLRTWPVPAGSACFSETIASSPELERAVAALLSSLGWEGIFELELIRCAPDVHVPIDLNPRPYGSMALAGDWLLGGSAGEQGQPSRAKPGIRYRWEDGELRHMAWQLSHGRLLDALRPLGVHRRVTHAIFEPNDPLPTQAHWIFLIEKACRRLWRRAVR